MSVIYDPQSQSIRGSFVNLVVTFSILGLIIYGVLFNETIVGRLVSLSSLILTFFGLSFGVWAAKSVINSSQSQQQ